MGYICKIDIFKPSGKWYTTEEVEFNFSLYELLPEEALKVLLKDKYKGMTAISNDLPTKFSYPVLVHL